MEKPIDFPKDYLGDSVYAELTPYHSIRLTTNNGYPDDPRNVIELEPDVLDALMNFIERVNTWKRVLDNVEGKRNGQAD